MIWGLEDFDESVLGWDRHCTSSKGCHRWNPWMSFLFRETPFNFYKEPHVLPFLFKTIE